MLILISQEKLVSDLGQLRQPGEYRGQWGPMKSLRGKIDAKRANVGQWRPMGPIEANGGLTHQHGSYLMFICDNSGP